MDEMESGGAQPTETWDSLAQLVNLSNPLFDKTLFLFGYDFSSNIYLIKGDYLSLIDAGNDYTAFMQLVDLGLKPWDIKKIVLTHGHVDHCMGVIELFRGYPKVAKEVEVILHGAGPQEFKNMAGEFGFRFTEVKGGETIELSGFELEVIHTPGHTLDGICLYHAPSRTLFTGDTVLPHAMAEMDEEGAGGRLDHYLYSLRTLLKKDIEHVMPGHGGLAINIGGKVLQETYEGLIKKLVGPETPWMQGATELAQKGLLEETIFYCDKELANNPENWQAWEYKAFCLKDLGRNQEALAVFDQILSQKSNAYLLMGKGCALMGLGGYEDSLVCFDEALMAMPQLAEAAIYKGMALYLAGRPEEAMEIEIFRKEFSARMKEELEKKGPSPGTA